MRILHQIEKLAGQTGELVLGIGFFDGVHRGHRRVLQTVLDDAREHAREAWVLTFSPHPLKLIAPERAPRMLTSLAHKLELLQAMGIAGTVVMPFDEALRHTPADTFMQHLLSVAPRLRHVVVGTNWSFGAGRAGNAEMLAAFAEKRGVSVTVAPPVTYGGAPISSTRIRHAVRAGNLVEAQALLGRPYSILGDVVRGDQLGRKLDFPTANIDPHNEVHPPDGVYAASTTVDGVFYRVAAYIGSRPTFEQRAWVVEAHLLDVVLDLYDQRMEVAFHSRIREDRRFDSVKALKAQIQRDIECVRELDWSGIAPP